MFKHKYTLHMLSQFGFKQINFLRKWYGPEGSSTCQRMGFKAQLKVLSTSETMHLNLNTLWNGRVWLSQGDTQMQVCNMDLIMFLSANLHLKTSNRLQSLCLQEQTFPQSNNVIYRTTAPGPKHDVPILASRPPRNTGPVWVLTAF